MMCEGTTAASSCSTTKTLQACTTQGLLETFQDMDAKLEKIQKSLENYLESKRQQVGGMLFS